MILKLSGMLSRFREKYPLLSSLVPRYFLVWIVYFAFLKAMFYTMELPHGDGLLLLFSLALMMVQPVRDFLMVRRLRRDEGETIEETGVLDEESFYNLTSLRQGPLPKVSLLLVLINVLVFIVMTLDGGTTNTEVLARYGAKIPELISVEGEYWRVLTANFIHVGFLHLLMNMLVLYLFGGIIERMYGSMEFWVIYFSAGIGGIAMSCLFVPYPGAGASGAIFGILGALVVMGFRYRKSIPLKFRDFYTWLLLFYIAMDFAFSLFVEVFDTYAHFGGFVTGLVIAYLLNLRPKVASQLLNKDLPPPSRLKKGFVTLSSLAFILISLASFALAFQNAFSPQPLYAKTALSSYSSLMGVKLAYPKEWKKISSDIPGQVAWQSPGGHFFSLSVEPSAGPRVSEALKTFLLLEKSFGSGITFSLLPKLSPFPKEIPQVTFRIYNPGLTLPVRPPCKIVSILIHNNYTYTFQIEGYQPERLRFFYRRLARKVVFQKPASFGAIKKIYVALIEKRPTDYQLLNGFGWFLARAKSDLDLGILAVRKALKILKEKYPSMGRPQVNVLDTLAELYFQKGQFSQAIKWIRLALKINPKNPYLQKQLKKFQEAYYFSQ